MIDLLASHGTRFTQFYAGAAESVASRGTLLSGQLSARGTPFGGSWVTVRPQDCTVAEMMYQGGYETGLFGVWGAGPVAAAGHPNQQGFKTFFGYLDDAAAADYYPTALWQNGEQIPLTGNRGGARKHYAPDLIVENAKRFIDTTCKRPFFLVVAFPMGISGGGADAPDFGPYADKDWPTADKARAAMITRVDGYIGQIVRRLDERRVLTRTIIAVTSDIGPGRNVGARFQSTGGLRGWSGDLYEGGIRVPLVVRWASCSPRMDCCECDLPFGMWDALPTLADLTETWYRPKAIDGVSIIRRLGGVPDTMAPLPAGALYWEKHGGGFGQAVRLDNWKAIRMAVDGPWEFYDLSADRAESTNATDAPADVKQRVNEFVERLRKP
jgi:arylsulfatase A-like enzyme